MKAIISLLLGYLLGCISPAKWIAGRKGVDLRRNGSGNLGATNTMLVLGPKYGFLVLAADMLKSVLAARIARRLFPGLAVAGLLGSLGAIVGHVFPWWMGFAGGKGLAAFAGLILAEDAVLFGILAVIALVLMLIVNYSFIAPMSAAVLLPFLAAYRSDDPRVFWICAAASGIIIVKHWSNIGKALRKDDIQVRSCIREKFLHKS